MSACRRSLARKSRAGGTQREPRLQGTLQAGAFDGRNAQDLKHLGQGIAGDGDGIDACVGEEAGKLGVIARRLAAQADPSSLAMGALDREPDHLLHAWILLVKDVRELLGVA